MGRTFIRQLHQVKNSDTYNDGVAATEAAMETNPTNIEDDLNSIRSQVKNILGTTNWWDSIGGRAIDDLHSDLSDIEGKKLLFRTEILTDVAVGAGNNFSVLSVAGSEAPSEAAAVGAGSANGALVALLAGASGTHSLNEIAGFNAVRPKNLCMVRDATSGDPILSGGKQVYALLQAESIVADGDAFDDTTKQAQLSFVIENATASDLIACPVADIEGKSINYGYARRINLDAVPEQAFLAGVFVDQSAAVDVTLNNAIDNQSGAATQTQDIDVKISSTKAWSFVDDADADLLRVYSKTGDSTSKVAVEAAVDLFDIDAVDNDFLNGIKVDSGGTQLNLGVTGGQIDSAGALVVATAAAGDLTLSAAGETLLVDGNKAGSSFAGSLKLSETSGEWDSYETKFGEVSLMNAIVQAANTAAFNKGVATVDSDQAADTNLNVGTNLTGSLPSLAGLTFATKVNVYLNGMLLRNGADAAANNDVYPGTTLADGDLKMEFAVKAGDVITVETFASL